MKLHFDPNQVYQAEAIKAVTDIFEGQPMSGGEFSAFAVSFGGQANSSLFYNEFGLSNMLNLRDEQIKDNLAVVQKREEMKEIPEYAGMNFSVEMETGTGKTYVYLRTIKFYSFHLCAGVGAETNVGSVTTQFKFTAPDGKKRPANVFESFADQDSLKNEDFI